MSECETIVGSLTDVYDHDYYCGVAYERWGRSLLQSGLPGHVVGEWLQRAMDCYERAATVRPAGDDNAILRWNACVRLMQRAPELQAESAVHEMHFGD